MGKILIANIGNRTLIEKNCSNRPIGYEPFITPEGKELKGGFKEITKTILDNGWFESVSINIIDKILDKYYNEIDAIYFFVSNQEGHYMKQDTLYAGEILKKIIPSVYTSIKVDNIHIVEIKAEIIKADALIPKYRNQILEIKKANSNKTFIFCDSGGTPQQKAAMKIVAEYVLNNEDYEYKQVVQKMDYNDTINYQDAEVKTIENIEYKRIVNNENIILLTKSGNYGAAKLLRKNAYNDRDKMYYALQFLDFRINRLKQEAKGFANRLQHLNGFSSIRNYLTNVPIGNYSGWENDFDSVDFFELCELLSIAQFYWLQGDLTAAVLNYQIFIENYCIYFIRKKKGTSFDLHGTRRTGAASNIVRELKSNFNIIEQYIPSTWTREKISVSLPTEIIYCEKVLEGSTKHQNVISTFKGLHRDLNNIDKGLNDLRNDIAHNGIGVINTAQINQFIESGNFEAIISQWHQAFGLPETNIYFKSNLEIENFIRDSTS